jgi:hypothetical protein
MLHSTLLLVALLSLQALAAPHKNAKRTFSVKQRSLPALSPASVLAKAYNKYGWNISDLSLTPVLSPVVSSLPLDLLSSHVKGTGSSGGGATTTSTSDDGEVTATPEENDTEFLAPVSIGGQTLALDFDTGSSDLWVYSTELPANERTGHTAFDPSKSSTFKSSQGSSWSITYGDGSFASGNVGTDVVNIGGASFAGQVVELAENVSSSFIADTNSDGLVGLAFSSLNTVRPVPAKTFFENVMPSLESPLFTAALRHGGGGTYNFGFIDNSQFTGSIAYAPVQSASGFWQFASSGATVGGKAIAGSSGNYIADTGTTLILVAPSIAAAYWSTVPSAKFDNSQGGYTFDCSATLPDFGLAITSTHTATVPGNLVNFAAIGATTCFGGIQGTGGNLMVLGDIFFKSQLVVFDGGNNQLGFAQAA